MLKSIQNKRMRFDSYPHSAMRFQSLDLSSSVIFLTGDNGSGKSTLLRIIDELADNINLGKDTRLDQSILDEIYDGYTLAWSQKLKKGYTFESEDFYTYLQWAKQERAIYDEIVEEVEQRHENKQSWAYLLESGLQKGNRASMDTMVRDYKDVSHGEGTIAFFASKLRPNKLYLLDEPEAPLSFENQLSLMRLIHEYTKKGCQFIIATHSPILLAFPNAAIYHFSDEIETVLYDDHPIVSEYRNYLSNPQRYLYYLLEEGDES